MTWLTDDKMPKKSIGLRFEKTEVWPGAWSPGTGIIQASGGKTDCTAVIKNPPGFSVG